MTLDEYMEEIFELSDYVNEAFTEDELDRLDFTIRSIIIQMGWKVNVL